MPRNKKRTTSSKKKKKQSSKSNIVSTTTGAGTGTVDLNQILSQADVAYETSNIEVALQLYSYAHSILQQTLQKQQQTISSSLSDEEQCVSNIITLSKLSCKIGEIKVSFHNPEDNGYNDFLMGIQLLSKENENKYITERMRTTTTTSVLNQDASMIAMQWKESRANLSLYLGQLSSEKDALNHFHNAIHDFKECMVVLEEQMKSNNVDVMKMVTETWKQLCGAYCSVAELYLTDLCYEPNAEQECENTLKLALELDKKQQQQNINDVNTTTPDAVQAMANLRLCQNRYMEAIPFILDAYSRMKVGCEAMADLIGLGRESKHDQKMDVRGEEEIVAKELKEDALQATNTLPGFEFRCQTAKILLECAGNLDQSKSTTATTTADQEHQLSIEKKEEQKMYCIEAAIQTLGSLMAENDEVIETWYLLGCAFQSKSSKSQDAAKHYFDKALEMLIKTKEQIERECDTHMDEGDEFNPLKDILEKIEDVENKIKEVEQNTCIDMDQDK